MTSKKAHSLAPHWRHWPSQPFRDKEPSSPRRLRGHTGDLTILQQRTLFIGGGGAVGGVAAQAAARHQIGRIILVDPDRYEADSHQTQPCLPTDAGRAKALVQAERVHEIYPEGGVSAAVAMAQDVPLSVLRKADVILSAGDNREVLVWLGQAGMHLGTPVIQGAVHGESWTAIMRAWNTPDPGAACPACGMSREEFSRQRDRRGCDHTGAPVLGGEPTRTLPVVCATAGQMATAEVLKLFLGIKEKALTGEEVTYCLQTHRLYRTELPRKRTCPCDHQRWRLVDLPRSFAETTPAILADGATPEAGIRVRADMPWIRFVLCPACRRLNTIRRFARLGEVVGRCLCGAELEASPVGKCAVLPADDLQACWETPLADLGLERSAAIGLSTGEEWTYYFSPIAPSEAMEREEENS